MKYICFDLGLHHTGVAVSHEGQISETLTTFTIKNPDKLINSILQLVKVEKPDVVIIGQPKRGPITSLADRLRDTLQSDFPGEIVLYNEDRSTSETERHFINTGATLAHRKKTQHQAAAALLLQRYLDSL